jgi:hypothetical protein
MMDPTRSRHVRVYFSVLRLHVFYAVVSFILTASYILSALVGHCDKIVMFTLAEYGKRRAVSML